MIYRTKVLLATGIVASMVPVASGPADAATVQAAAAEYGGYTAEAWSTPLRIEVYEPSIPLPANPQVELEAGYSKVKADSGSSSGRSSWFWPGDPVGEGLRVFGEQLGLPADNPITGPGYTVQVNSQYPGDPATAKDEPAPGMVMRTTSGDKTARAEVGFSPDGVVLGPEAGEGPQGSANPLMGLQEQLGKLLSGGLLPGAAAPSAKATPGTAPAAETPTAPPGLGGLEALIDVDGYVSVSNMKATEGPVVGSSRSELGQIRLLGGLITLGGFETVAKATSDGAKGVATGKSTWGKLTLAGVEFSMGPDGAVAAGKPMPIPGLNALPADALQMLGIKIEIPKAKRTVEGDKAESLSEGLRITIDSKVLSPVLSAIPSAQLANLLPPLPGQANMLKGILSGLSNLAPKIVMTFGVASAKVDTVPKMSFPATPPAGGDAPEGGGAPAGDAGGAAGAAGTPPAATGGAPATTGAGGAPAGGGEATGELPPVTNASGLPELFSIPGLLLIAAFAAAAVAGSWFRRIGAAALGGGGACPHGLDSGLPDLRKA